MTHTDADFDHLSWHDCRLWGVQLRSGDGVHGDWTSDLALDIDFIVEWMCGVGGGAQFRVAPATLVFHGVTDARIAIDWGDSGHRTALHEAAIDSIAREPLEDAKVYPGRAYFRWRILFSWPEDGEISFGAAGFTQTLLAEPIVTERQHLTIAERTRLLGG